MAKIKGDDLAFLRDCISRLDIEDNRNRYREGKFPRADRVNDLDMRYRWDLLWASVPASFIGDLYNKGCNDTHIDTALRSIVPDLGAVVADDYDLDTFLDAYIECAFWVGVNDSSDDEPIYEGLGKSDLSDGSLNAILEDCMDFVLGNRADLDAVGTPAQHGHDFFLTRNGHGTGFWDRGYGEVGTRLTEASRPYGEQSLYLADEGSVEV